jgi:hypothetical protein
MMLSSSSRPGPTTSRFDATERNLAGLAAIARLISPDVEDRLRQVQRLLWETRDARQAIPR